VNDEERKAYRRGVLHGCAIAGGVAAFLVQVAAPQIWRQVLFALVGLVVLAVLVLGLVHLGTWLNERYDKNQEQFERVWKVIGYIVVTLIVALFVWRFFTGPPDLPTLVVVISVATIYVVRYIFKHYKNPKIAKDFDLDVASPKTIIECPVCGGSMGLRLVAGEKTWVCRSFPTCNGTRPHG